MSRGKDNLHGIAYMLVAAMSFAAFSAIAKFAIPTIPLMEIVFFRGIIAFLLLAGYEKVRFGRLTPAVAHKDLIIRALLGLTGLTMYVYALTHVHLGLASALNQSSPLFVALFAFLLLRERSSFWLFPLILLGFTGAMLIISPDFGGIDFNALVGLGSAVVAGLAYTWVRKLRKTDQPQTIVRWFSGTVTLAALPVVTIQGWVLPNAFESLLLLGLGVFSLSGQLGLTNAFRRGESAVVSPFIYISVLVSLVLGWAIWSEWPGPIALAGAVLLVTSSIGVAVIGARTPSVEA